MQTLIPKIEFHISRAEKTSLDQKWNSSFFLPAYRCVPFSRLYLPCCGKGIIVCDGQTYTLKKGCIFLISPFARVHLSCPKFLVKYWCHFNDFAAGSSNDIFSMLPGVTEIRITDEQLLYYEKLFEQILISKSDISNPSSSSLLNTMYANAALNLLAAPFLNSISQSHVSNHKIDRIFMLIQYMNEHLASEITLKDLAGLAGLHPNYLSSVFYQCMGMSPIAFLSTLRLNYAITELQKGVLRIGEIAEKVGFDNKSSFAKFFHQHTGISARSWREKYNQDPQNVPL